MDFCTPTMRAFSWPHSQDCVREKMPSLKHYANYNTFATMLFKRCSVLMQYQVSGQSVIMVKPSGRMCLCFRRLWASHLACCAPCHIKLLIPAASTAQYVHMHAHARALPLPPERMHP